MRSRTYLAVVAALIALAATALPSAPSAQASATAPLIAVIDTGLNPAHQEFDYDGRTSTTDQIEAWFDFSAEAGSRTPAPGQLWDDVKLEPYDPHGHGTLTAGMAAGRGVTPGVTTSFCKGCRLAIAKVGSGSGARVDGDLAAAIRWAFETVKADVITMSIGSIVPIPMWNDLHEHFVAARRAGTFSVVSNGNGYLNAGIPGSPGWATNYGNSLAVLSVGASGGDGYWVTTDPEVTAQFTVVGPARRGTTALVRASGTSFSAPLVAGFAARLQQEATQSGRRMTPEALERLVKYSAVDSSVPPPFEGYGRIDNIPSTVDPAVAHARAGTLPARPSPDVNAIYVDSVVSLLRAVGS